MTSVYFATWQRRFALQLADCPRKQEEIETQSRTSLCCFITGGFLLVFPFFVVFVRF